MEVKKNVHIIKLGYMIQDNMYASTRDAVLLAASRGLLVDLYTIQVACNGTESEEAMQEFAEMGVKIIMSSLCSGATLKASALAQELDALLVSNSATSPALTNQSGPNFFRTAPSDIYQGRFLANKMKNDTKLKSILILAQDGLYANGITTELQKSFNDNNHKSTVQVLSADSAGKVDVSGKPDGVAIFTNSQADAADALKSLNKQGFKGAVYGADSMYDTAIVAMAGAAANGMMLSSLSLGTESFQEMYMEKFGIAPEPFAAVGYDAMRAINTAIKNSGYSTNTSKLIKEMRKVNLAEGASNGGGRISFDAHGDLKVFNPDSFKLYKVVAGKYELQN